MPKAAIKIGKRVVAVSNLDKVLYPGGRFTKANVLDYYARVGPFLLPHFENRPVTLVRYLDGVFGESFFEKNAPGVTAEDMPKLHWLRPELVANVAFTEWTNYGLLRHATFLGLREDKEPTEVIREVPAASNGKVPID